MNAPKPPADAKATVDSAFVDNSQMVTLEVTGEGDTGRPNDPTVAGLGRMGAHALPEKFGRYRIRRQIGRGGMGSVYLADDEQLHREVALKIPHVAGDDPAKFVARLMREARSAAALRHPNICPVYDVGEFEGVHYLAMAYIAGRPLLDYVKAGKPQSERSIAITVYKIAQALAEAHSHGVLHRDLKPANIMVDARGEPIVMDFGLSQQLHGEGTRITREGTIVGTPAYMAPEQIDNRASVGPAADIYSLGVVLFELLTRRCPFEGSAVSVIGQVLHAPVPSIKQFRSDASPAVVAICEKAMAKNPGERYASMKDFAAALMGFIKGKSSTTSLEAATLPDLTAIDPLTIAPTVPAHQRLPSQQNQETWIYAAAGGGLALVVLLAVFALVRAAWNGTNTTATNGAPSAPTANTATPAVPTLPVASGSNTKSPTTGDTEPSPPPATAESPAATATSTNDPAENEPGATDPPSSVSTPSNESVTPPVTLSPVEDQDAPPVSSPTPNDPASPDDGPGPPPPPDEMWTTAGRSKNKLTITQLFKEADHNDDDRLDPGEAPFHIIERADKNRDHLLTLAELRQAYERKKERLFDEPTEEERRALPPPPPPRGPGEKGPPRKGPGDKGPRRPGPGPQPR
jgi:serine/threonine protein kinase